mmetsp:Transcript_8020/g.24163  ORF Transcript_8020/g.24163 Transcript_8020/m.24163 type:complete len:265 (-) Transcript_8020:56-850(-)
MPLWRSRSAAICWRPINQTSPCRIPDLTASFTVGPLDLSLLLATMLVSVPVLLVSCLKKILRFEPLGRWSSHWRNTSLMRSPSTAMGRENLWSEPTAAIKSFFETFAPRTRQSTSSSTIPAPMLAKSTDAAAITSPFADPMRTGTPMRLLSSSNRLFSAPRPMPSSVVHSASASFTFFPSFRSSSPDTTLATAQEPAPEAMNSLLSGSSISSSLASLSSALTYGKNLCSKSADLSDFASVSHPSPLFCSDDDDDSDDDVTVRAG